MYFDECTDRFKEECGVFGIFSKDAHVNVGYLTYLGLNSLQHRGQESCGIAFCNKNKLQCINGMGLVSEFFNKKNLMKIKGKYTIGHVRYSTFGENKLKNAQPILDSYGTLAIAHNGNISNANILKEYMKKKGFYFNTSTDSEVILKLIEKDLKNRISIKKAIINSIKKLKGAYAMLILTEDKLLGIRDPNGIRPLCIGKLHNSYILSSESCALDTIGAKFIRDVEPGEIIIIDEKGISSIKPFNDTKNLTCAFEYIYFSRADSIIDEVDVYKSRYEAGKQLYKECSVEGDVVIGVPDSGIPAALGYSKESGIPYEIGFEKNKYIGRTFIQPKQKIREINTDIKLNVIKRNVEGKRVIVVDDSIVRGTTSKKIVKLLRKAGAKEVHFRIPSPVIRHCCHLGINTPCESELIGFKKEIYEIAHSIEADSLGYISIPGFLKIFRNKKLCTGCFNGDYPI